MARQIYILSALVSCFAACGGRTIPSGDDAGRLDQRVVIDTRSYLDGEPAFCSAAMPTCSLQEYCATFAGDCEGVGYCMPRPTACPENCPGVCGCDGKTYCNACEANSQGVALRGEAPCPEGTECRFDDDCASGEYCHADGCLGFDAIGECRLRPEDCMQELFPVCGCDGRTYFNQCSASVMGINVDYQGRCEICANLEGGYAILLQSAKSCCADCDGVQCTEKVDDRLLCGCPTSVDLGNSLEIDEMSGIELRWRNGGCYNAPPCPPFACQELQMGQCAPDAAGEGSCQDVYR